MTETAINPLEATDTEVARAYAAERKDNIRTFVRTSPDYYIKMFDKIGASAKFTPTLNLTAGLFGPIWFGARGLWNWALPFLIIEALAIVQIARGLFGDLAADAMARIASIEGTLELRRKQLASAIENNTDKIDVYQRTVDSLEANIGGIRDEGPQPSPRRDQRLRSPVWESWYSPSLRNRLRPTRRWRRGSPTGSATDQSAQACRCCRSRSVPSSWR